LRKERFPEQQQSKLHHRGDGPFQAVDRINANAYKIQLPSEYGVSNSFNVLDLSLYNAGDEAKALRRNFVEEGGE
jgi:hypothetical protein